ncbi:MAG: lasso peptide biosynthesis B2 protein [Victivallaceae bacterium]|nr:lasso peptide biosynthesis B2 protein [Victivallaceae bacterium]
MFKAFKSFVNLPFGGKKTVIEAVCLLLFARLLLVLPYKYMKPFLGNCREAPEKATDLRELHRISGCIRRVGNRLPWKCSCLVNALAAKIMLKKRGIPATIYFGMTRDDEMRLVAHAWVKSGDFLVTGKDNEREYKTVGYFS